MPHNKAVLTLLHQSNIYVIIIEIVISTVMVKTITISHKITEKLQR